jgi:hypothetical protein
LQLKAFYLSSPFEGFFSEQNGARQLLFRSTSLTREYFPAALNPILLVDWLSDFRANIQVHDAFIHFISYAKFTSFIARSFE